MATHSPEEDLVGCGVASNNSLDAGKQVQDDVDATVQGPPQGMRQDFYIFCEKCCLGQLVILSGWHRPHHADNLQEQIAIFELSTRHG